MNEVTTIDHQNDEIEALLLDGPGLKTAFADTLALIYPKAVRDTCRETGLPETEVPAVSPYRLDQIVDPSFLSDGLDRSSPWELALTPWPPAVPTAANTQCDPRAGK